jgi:hypothetical protein
MQKKINLFINVKKWYHENQKKYQKESKIIKIHLYLVKSKYFSQIP